MSTTLPSPPAGPPASPALSASGLRVRVARHRTSLVVTLALVAAVVVALLFGGGARSEAPLDPDNPAPGGARALARVLDDQGVDVTVARSADLLEQTRVDAATTVLVTSTSDLGDSTLDRLETHAGDATLVLVAPEPRITALLGYADGASLTPDDERPADCVGTDLVARFDDLTIDVTRGAEYPSPDGCFRGPGGAALAQPEEGVLLLGATDLLTNDRILRRDNAAAALRLLGQGDRLVWYVPDRADLVAADAVSISRLLPDWLMPALWLTVLAVGALALWRGRRLGALVTEPLPVAVKAIESTRSRGRLYRKVADRGHAAAALRTAARVSLAERLALPATIDPAVLARDVARHTGRPLPQVEHLLLPSPPAPTTDDDLVRLAGDLATLDREVRRP